MRLVIASVSADWARIKLALQYNAKSLRNNGIHEGNLD